MDLPNKKYNRKDFNSRLRYLVRYFSGEDKKDDTGHDHFLRLDGIRGYAHSVKNGGQEITICGWDDSHFKYKKNDLILLENQDNSQTRYRVESLRPCGNPSDMYFMDCVFAPRSCS